MNTPLKLGFAGVYLIFLFLLQNIDCGYTLEPPRLGEAVLTCTHNLCFEQKYAWASFRTDFAIIVVKTASLIDLSMAFIRICLRICPIMYIMI